MATHFTWLAWGSTYDCRSVWAPTGGAIDDATVSLHPTSHPHRWQHMRLHFLMVILKHICNRGPFIGILRYKLQWVELYFLSQRSTFMTDLFHQKTTLLFKRKTVAAQTNMFCLDSAPLALALKCKIIELQNNIKAGKQQKIALLQEERHIAQTS